MFMFGKKTKTKSGGGNVMCVCLFQKSVCQFKVPKVCTTTYCRYIEYIRISVFVKSRRVHLYICNFLDCNHVVCLYQKSVCQFKVLVCKAVRLAFSCQTSAISIPFIPIPWTKLTELTAQLKYADIYSHMALENWLK